MEGYLKLDKAGIVAFFFTERDKDYGGIHLGVPESSNDALLGLAHELDRLPPGHSRRLSLLPVSDDLPQRIAGRRRYCPLFSLRVGTSPEALTQIQIKKQDGTVMLSPNGLVEFRRAITLMHSSRGDLVLAGNSGLWTDRLWFWSL